MLKRSSSRIESIASSRARVHLTHPADLGRPPRKISANRFPQTDFPDESLNDQSGEVNQGGRPAPNNRPSTSAGVMNTTMKASKVTGRVCRPASGVAQRRHCLGGSLYPGEKTSRMYVCVHCSPIRRHRTPFGGVTRGSIRPRQPRPSPPPRTCNSSAIRSSPND